MKTLVSQDIQTTAIEIDPFITSLVQKYFNLPGNLTMIHSDAIVALSHWDSKQFDYIIHDVFAGGTEPLNLFTVEFLRNIRAVLSDTGFVAIV